MNLNSISSLSRSSKISILVFIDYCIFTFCFIFNNYLNNLYADFFIIKNIYTLYFINIFSIFIFFYLFKNINYITMFMLAPEYPNNHFIFFNT